VTHIPFEDDMDLVDMNFNPQRGESVEFENQIDRYEPDRDADLSLGEAGTSWNAHLGENFAGKGPRGWRLSDEKLKERVSEVLMRSHEVDPSRLEVFVDDGVVTLKGEIESKGMRRVAEDLVGSIPGVEDVFTELKIFP
jgi:osmotically-inducible protein OsmY